MEEGPLAILPYEKKNLSFVWSIDHHLFNENKNNLKNLINDKLKKIYKKKIDFKISNIQFYPINLNLQTKYFKKNILILGDGLHSIHPIAGQGFNLVIRDLIKLNELLKSHLNLGLAIKNSTVLEDFYNSRKTENIIFGLGVDVTRTFFKRRKLVKPLQNIILKNIGKYKLVKKFSKLVANRGIL